MYPTELDIVPNANRNPGCPKLLHGRWPTPPRDFQGAPRQGRCGTLATPPHSPRPHSSGLRTCFRDGYKPRVAGRLREGSLTCRRPAHCMPHSHGLLYEEHQTLSCSCHTAGLRNGINRLGCWVRLMSRSRTLSPHAVSTGSWRMRLNVCEGPMLDIIRVSSGGPRATVSKQVRGETDRLQTQIARVSKLCASCDLQPLISSPGCICLSVVEMEHFHVIVIDRHNGAALLEDSTVMN
jgi:hypothetical protein